MMFNFNCQRFINNKNGNVFSAFTLAEVLITLGIIGVVAALTIPTLISSRNKSIVETRLKSFYSTMEQAVRLSELDNGDKKDWDAMTATSQGASDWFDKYLKSYVKVSEVDTTTLSANNMAILYFPDGSAVSFNTQVWSFYPDASGLKLSTKISGKTFFNFLFAPSKTTSAYTYLYSKGLEPYKYAWDGTENGTNGLRTHVTYGCNTTSTSKGAYCTALIQTNGWKVPDNYPYSF